MARRTEAQASEGQNAARRELEARFTLAGLTRREWDCIYLSHAITSSGRKPDKAKIGALLGIKRQNVARYIENGLQRLSILEGHAVSLPAYDGVARTIDAPPGGFGWYGEVDGDSDEQAILDYLAGRDPEY